MPQLDPTWFASQIFWLCVCFGALYFVVSRYLAPRISQTLEARQNKIDSYLKKAQELKTQAEESLSAYEKALGDAKEKAEMQIIKQKDDLQKMIEDKNQEISDKISSEVAKTQNIVEKAKQEMLDKVDDIAASLSKDIIKKMDV